MTSPIDYSSLPDQQLVELALQKDERAKTTLFDRYYPDVFSQTFQKLDNYDQAETVTQEAFIGAFKSLHTHNPRFTCGVQPSNRPSTPTR